MYHVSGKRQLCSWYHLSSSFSRQKITRSADFGTWGNVRYNKKSRPWFRKPCKCYWNAGLICWFGPTCGILRLEEAPSIIDDIILCGFTLTASYTRLLYCIRSNMNKPPRCIIINCFNASKKVRTSDVLCRIVLMCAHVSYQHPYEFGWLSNNENLFSINAKHLPKLDDDRTKEACNNSLSSIDIPFPSKISSIVSKLLS